jgi:hypothetical protein
LSEVDYRQVLNAFADAVVMADGTGRQAADGWDM